MDARHHEQEQTYTPPEIDMIDVDSTAVARIGHHSDLQTMRVQFPARGTEPPAVFDYVGVPEEKYFEVANAESVGRAYRSVTKELGIKGIRL